MRGFLDVVAYMSMGGGVRCEKVIDIKQLDSKLIVINEAGRYLQKRQNKL